MENRQFFAKRQRNLHPGSSDRVKFHIHLLLFSGLKGSHTPLSETSSKIVDTLLASIVLKTAQVFFIKQPEGNNESLS